MRFELRVATRYLLSARLQSGLLVVGVAVGVVVFTFIAALMNGLSDRLIADVTGNVAHITLEPLPRRAAQFMAPATGTHPKGTCSPATRRVLTAHQFAVVPGHDARPMIRTYRPAVALALATPGVRAAVPEAVGPGTLARGDRLAAVTITGLTEATANVIAPLEASLVRGRLQLGPGDVLVGSRLAAELGVDVGERVVLSAQNTHTTMTVRGVFTLGVQAVDERSIYVELGAAQKLLGYADGVTRIELKLADVWRASHLAQYLQRLTQLRATSWIESNVRLQDGLRAQSSTAEMIKGFSLLTIAIGVASALLLSVSRRRAEIGIMRSFGIGRGTVIRTFVIQGVLIGLGGSLLGAALGYGFAELLRTVSMRATGAPTIPIDPAQGEYFRAIALATIASAIATILPARAAANIDPLQAIQS